MGRKIEIEKDKREGEGKQGRAGGTNGRMGLSRGGEKGG